MVATVDLRSPQAGRHLAAALKVDACAFVVGHGVDPGLRREMVRVTRQFFDLDPADKEELRWDGNDEWKGWQPVYQGRFELTGDRVPDLLERFEVQRLERFELWPANPSDFEGIWRSYYEACSALASTVVETLAAPMSLPAQMMPAWTTHQFANLVANHYLPQPEPPLESQVRTGAHTDRGGITLLWAEQAPGGLEISPPGSREWVQVMIPEDAFILQVGDMFSRWTNGRVRANLHRVANPPRHLGAVSSRLALVYFHYPSLDTVIEPVIADPAERALPPMRAEDHFFHRQEHFRRAPDYLGAS